MIWPTFDTSIQILQIMWHSELYSKLNLYNWIRRFHPHFPHRRNHRALSLVKTENDVRILQITSLNFQNPTCLNCCFSACSWISREDALSCIRAWMRITNRSHVEMSPWRYRVWQASLCRSFHLDKMQYMTFSCHKKLILSSSAC